ncbi:MAG: DUF1517 domain-containing protein [Coleofasciculaceae cyanobacterium]
MNELENDIVTVSKLQVALSSSAPSVQSELSQLTLEADTATTQGLKKLLEDAVVTLLRNTESWTHVFGSSETISNREAAETVFNRLSIEERSKFSAETLTNVDGKIRQRELIKPEKNDDGAAYIVVTLLVGTADDRPLFASIDTSEEMQEILKQVAAMQLDYLMVFELLWSPQVDTDTLTEAELAAEYGGLVAI